MDDFQKISLLLNFANIVVLPLGIFLYRYIKHWRQENEKIEAEKRKHVDLMRNLVEMGEAYVALGGNGDGHSMLDKIKDLDVDDGVLKKWYEKRLHYEV